MECTVLSRFCHSPVSSYLQGNSDIELRSIRYGILDFIFEMNCSCSTFGIGIMRLLLDHCQADCLPGYVASGDLPSIAWDFHQDLSYVFLVYSPRNVAKFSQDHPHYQDAYDRMKSNNMVHHFCTKCDDVQCLVNSTMLRIIYVCMHYLDAVSCFTFLFFVTFS